MILPFGMVKKNTADREEINEQFAIIETGGKQYMVSQGDRIAIELIGEYKVGDEVVFDKVLMTSDDQEIQVGEPYLQNFRVTGTYKGEVRGKKLSIIRFKAKSNRSRKIGHRQRYANIEITSVR